MEINKNETFSVKRFEFDSIGLRETFRESLGVNKIFLNKGYSHAHFHKTLA